MSAESYTSDLLQRAVAALESRDKDVECPNCQAGNVRGPGPRRHALGCEYVNLLAELKERARELRSR